MWPFCRFAFRLSFLCFSESFFQLGKELVFLGELSVSLCLSPLEDAKVRLHNFLVSCGMRLNKVGMIREMNNKTKMPIP